MPSEKENQMFRQIGTEIGWVIVIMLGMTPVAWGQDVEEEDDPRRLPPVVITPHRGPTSSEEVGESIDVLTGDEIQDQHVNEMGESIRNIPGVRAQRRGGPGAQTKIRIRGGRSSDTQLMIGGMPFRDASTTQGDATSFFQEFQDFSSGWLEQVEVMKGSSATLYGSDGQAGTINLIPRRGKMGPPVFETSIEIGSMETFIESALISGGTEQWDYLATATRLDTDGIDQHGFYESSSFNANIGYLASEKLEFRWFNRFVESSLALDTSPGILNGIPFFNADDPNDERKSDIWHSIFEINHATGEDWDHSLKIGLLQTSRRTIIRPDPLSADLYKNDQRDGETWNLDYQQNRQWGRHYVTFGGEYEEELFVQNASNVREKFNMHRHSFYFQDQVSLLDDTLYLTLGGRWTRHERFGDRNDFSGSAAYLVNDRKTKLHAHIGSGFRSPSLFELFGVTTLSSGTRFVFGNPNVKPEKSISADVGISHQWFDSPDWGMLETDVTLYGIRYEKIILFGGGTYNTVDGSGTQGLEFSGVWSPTKKLFFRGSYTHTDGHDSSGLRLDSTPYNQWGLNTQYQATDKLSFNVDMSYQGEQDVKIFGIAPLFIAQIIPEKEIFKTDVVAQYQITDQGALWIRVDNLFDENYTESGFRAPRLGVFFGTEWTFGGKDKEDDDDG